MAEDTPYLIAGLGNPGGKYRNTKHNLGFMVIDELAEHYGVSLAKNRFEANFGAGRIEGEPVILVKPMSFMNLSGRPLIQIANYFKLSGEKMLIVHDDIDLALGRIKIKEKGGHGGHRGLKSIMEAFGEGDFVRLRIGIGRPENELTVSNHVLSNFAKADMHSLARIIGTAREAVITILCKGAKESMNLFNRKQSTN